MSGGSQLGKKGRWSCLPRLPNDRRETVREDPAGLPPVDHEQGCQGDPLLAVLDLGQDPDPEQVGRRGLLEERPPEEEGEDHRRREKGEGLGFFGLVESCLLYTSPSPRDLSTSRMPSSA